jgi:hypothetical protein
MTPERLEDDQGHLLAVYDPETNRLAIKARGMKVPKEFDLTAIKAGSSRRRERHRERRERRDTP